MPERKRLRPGEARSAGTNPERRIPQAWPRDRRFRILSIDGGGIRGVFPAAVLAGLERDYTGGRSLASCFDLVTGTSTGGILAIGLGAGLSAEELLRLYVERGCEVFPPLPGNALGRLRGHIRDLRHYAHYLYDRDGLENVLAEKLGDRLFGESVLRLCIPSFEGRHSEVFVYKTPHHADYQTDRHELMVDVALATAAAPSYFRPLEHGGYTLVDGGVWANNPVMLAVIEALICFDIGREQIDVLSLGCGDDRYVVSGSAISKGGLWHWRTIMEAAMRLQSLAATNQTRLLLGPPSVIRIDPPNIEPTIRMDDWRRASTELVPAGEKLLAETGEQIAELFFQEPTMQYVPVPTVAD